MHEQRARSIHGLLVLTAWADGRIVAPELFVEHAILGEVPELTSLYDKRGLADAAKRALDELGLDAAVAQIAEPLRTREDQELAFVCCVRILEADGVIAPEEFRVLRILRRLFGFTQDDVNRLISR
ncbi:MAG TPA: TerB family tellurite resistance protein [Myxococcales bacterium]|jgi:tellurite resistance protein TerB|nr:TerB family tellurite resistance protein [Myxococcales bacterium]